MKGAQFFEDLEIERKKRDSPIVRFAESIGSNHGCYRQWMKGRRQPSERGSGNACPL